MGEILWGFSYARKARWKDAKKTKASLLLSGLPTPD